MTYFVIVKQDGDTARLECETWEEAQMVRRSFVNYGKCSDVKTEYERKIVAAEREACAKMCEYLDAEYEGEDVLGTWCAAAIRARGNE
jgi:hypothetical protein